MANNTEDVELKERFKTLLDYYAMNLGATMWFNERDDGIGGFVQVAEDYAKQRELALLERLEDLNFEFMEPCEPDCSDVRHARHEGSWEHYWRMKAAIQKEKEKL